MEAPIPGTPVIIDVGGAYVKIGFAGEKEPRHVFPCITGTEKYKSVMADVGTRSIYVGEDAMRMRGVLKVSNPIQRGAIMDWNAYYEIINHIFYDLLRLEDLGMHPVYGLCLSVRNRWQGHIAQLCEYSRWGVSGGCLWVPSLQVGFYLPKKKESHPVFPRDCCY